MALTFRSGKGSALTHDELDNNFRHFTGSHDITGSLTVSGSGTLTNIGSFSQTGDSTFTGNTTFAGSSSFTGNITGSGNISSSGNFTIANITTTQITASGNISSSAGTCIFGGLPTADPLVTGSLWVSGSINNAAGIPAGYIMISGITG
jgi:hypothetical protein